MSNKNYHISHTRLYSLKGGIIRFKFSVSALKEAVDAETQFVSRSMKSESGDVNKDLMSGPDDNEFVVRTLKGASETFDAFIPKHLKPSDISMVVYSDSEITITLAESGQTSKTSISQLYELMRSLLLNFILQLWFQKSGAGDVSQSFAGLVSLARQNIQRVLMHSFVVRRTYGSRYPIISTSDIAMPLQGKFLGTYRTDESMNAIHGTDLEEADIAYVEEHEDYRIYDGAAWAALKDLVGTATSIDAKEHADYPSCDAGDLYFITRSGTLGEYKDRVYAGDALLCIRNNESNNYANNLSNFIALGLVSQTD